MSGSYDRRVRLIDSSTGKCDRTIQGHAGSIRCVYVSEERGIVLSGGYDTSIRYLYTCITTFIDIKNCMQENCLKFSCL